jgi:hypothetical protein
MRRHVAMNTIIDDNNLNVLNGDMAAISSIETFGALKQKSTSYATIKYMHIWGAIDKNYCDTASSNYKMDCRCIMIFTGECMI